MQGGEVVAMLEAFRTRYPTRFGYSCTVDEEGSVIDAGTILRSTELAVPAPAPARSSPSMFKFWAGGEGRESSAAPPVPTAPSVPAATVNSDACAYHGAKRLAVSDDRDAPAAAGEPCQCQNAHGNRVRGGKNLLIVSGPDGFIAHYAGAKVWGVGKELQGPVRGVIGELQRKYPSLGQDWLVLKM